MGAGGTALYFCRRHLALVQLLCAHGAARTDLISADGRAIHGLPAECLAWLLEMRRWTSELHHVEFLPPARVRALLAAGADLRASDGQGQDAPTPLRLARALLPHESAQLVLDAAAPWSPRTHSLFPAAARARAVALLLLGRLLCQQTRFVTELSS